VIAERADGRSNGDGALSEIELDHHLVESNRGGQNATRRVSEQALAMLRSRIARSTSEPDLLRVTNPDGGPPSGVELLQRYARVVYNSERRLPDIVGYVLSAADLREDVVERDGHFVVDEALPANARARPADFANQGFDLGHMRPAGDSATTQAMTESFLMSNITPQAPTLNRQVLRQLEDAIRGVVRAIDGRATVLTGSLFLNERGEPMSPPDVQWITRSLRGKQQQRVAIPTHIFKVALFEQSNGAMTVVGFVVPNSDDVPSTRDEIAPFMHGSRRSVRDIQRLTGLDLFRDLPDAIEAPMEESRDACITLPRGTEVHAVSLLWPANCRPQSWTRSTQPATTPPSDDTSRLTRILRTLKFW
jgi:endonuclease G